MDNVNESARIRKKDFRVYIRENKNKFRPVFVIYITI